MSTYGFTDMELLKDWKQPFTIISGMADIELMDDDDYRAEWMKKDDKSYVFTKDEDMIIISG